MIEQISTEQLAQMVADSSGFNVGNILGVVKQVTNEPASGIGCSGRGAHRVYIRKKNKQNVHTRNKVFLF